MRLEVVSGDALIPNPRWLQQDPLCVCVTSVPTALLKSQRFWDVLGWEGLLAQPRSEFRWFCFFYILLTNQSHGSERKKKWIYVF